MALLTLQLLSPPEDLLHTRTAKNRAAWGHRAQGRGRRGSENRARGKGRARGGRAGGAGSRWPMEPLSFVSSFLLRRQPCRRGDR